MPLRRRGAARRLQPHGPHGRRQDAGVAGFRARARRAARARAGGGRHPLHLHHRAEREGVPRGARGGRGRRAPQRVRPLARDTREPRRRRKLGRARHRHHDRAALREPLRQPAQRLPQAPPPGEERHRPRRGADAPARHARAHPRRAAHARAALRGQRGDLHGDTAGVPPDPLAPGRVRRGPRDRARGDPRLRASRTRARALAGVGGAHGLPDARGRDRGGARRAGDRAPAQGRAHALRGTRRAARARGDAAPLGAHVPRAPEPRCSPTSRRGRRPASRSG